MKYYILTSDYIELIKLLKVMGFAETGGAAKMMVMTGDVMLNGIVEYRKKAKVRAGDLVEIGKEKISIG